MGFGGTIVVQRDGMIYERLPLGKLPEPLDLPGYLRQHGLQAVVELSGWWQRRKFMVWTERE